MAFAPRPSALSLATSQSSEMMVQRAFPRLPGCGAGPRPAPCGSCRLRAKGMRWEGHLPNLFTARPLSPAPICGLPLSQRGQPRVPSSSLPTAHFLPATQCYRNMHTELGSRACVCVCAQVYAHTPEILSLERSQGAWGYLKRQPPQDSYLTPLKTCPPSSPCSRDRHL